MKKIFLITLILPFIYLSGIAQGVKLSINLPEGYKYGIESEVDLFIEQEFMGIRYSTKMEISTVLYMEVKGLDADSTFILSASYRKMKIRVTSLLINMEVNSESILPGDSLSFILQSLQGKVFRINIGRNGRISNIAGLDEMITETIASSSLQGEQKTEFTRNLIQSLGKEVILDNYSNNSSFYPDFRVKAPAVWDFKSEILKSGIPMELNSHIRLKSISKGIAFMVSEGSIIKQKYENQRKLNPSDTKIFNLSGDEISEVKMDIKTGLILESIISQNVSGTLRTPSGEGTDEEIFIPFKIISRSTVTITPLK